MIQFSVKVDQFVLEVGSGCGKDLIWITGMQKRAYSLKSRKVKFKVIIIPLFSIRKQLVKIKNNILVNFPCSVVMV